MLMPVLDFRGHWRCGMEAFAVLWRNHTLIAALTRKELKDPHGNQILGGAWAFMHPFLIMGVYATVFGIAFRARFGGTRELPLDYTVYILSGMVPWMSFQQALTRSASSITANVSFVRQVVFPVEVLLAKSALAPLAVLAVGLAFISVYTLFAHGSLQWTYLLLPILVLLQCAAMIGFGYALAGLTVFVEDVKEIVAFLSTINIFLMPVVYQPSAIPAVFRPIVYINPFSYMVWCYQDVLYFGRIEHPGAWIVFFLFSVLAFVLGYRLFRKLKTMFGNVL